MKGERTLKKEEVLRDFTFTNDYVFCSILTENPHICKKIAELATGRKIKEIVKVQAQKSIKKSKDGKGVRFDVVFEDDENNVYDIEMQKLKRGNIPKRARYYQSLLDLESLGKGKNKPYRSWCNGPRNNRNIDRKDDRYRTTKENHWHQIKTYFSQQILHIQPMLYVRLLMHPVFHYRTL